MKRLAQALPLIVLMAGCRPSVPPPDTETATRKEAADAPASASEPAAPAGADTAPAGVTMRYRCEQDHRVDIVGGNTAHVTLADGRVVDIPRVADSTPPRYAGEALSFEVGSDGATLGQDEVGGFACREAD